MGLELARRARAWARGSSELANCGLRALGEARKTNFTLQRNLCTNAVAGLQWAGLAGQALELQQARRGWAQARGSPELANSGLRALGEARKANSEICVKMLLVSCGGLGWLGRSWVRTGQERSALGEGKL